MFIIYFIFEQLYIKYNLEIYIKKDINKICCNINLLINFFAK